VSILGSMYHNLQELEPLVLRKRVTFIPQYLRFDALWWLVEVPLLQDNISRVTEEESHPKTILHWASNSDLSLRTNLVSDDLGYYGDGRCFLQLPSPSRIPSRSEVVDHTRHIVRRGISFCDYHAGVQPKGHFSMRLGSNCDELSAYIAM